MIISISKQAVIQSPSNTEMVGRLGYYFWGLQLILNLLNLQTLRSSLLFGLALWGGHEPAPCYERC